MKNVLTLATLTVFAASANALTLTLENPLVAATIPATGTATYAIRGTLTLEPGETFSGGGGGSPFNSTGQSLDFRGNPFVISSALANSNTFTGELAFIDVASTDAPGLYNLDALGILPPSLGFEAIGPSGSTLTTFSTYSVEVAPVPEPASFAALGIAALALLRRRKS